MPTPDDEFLRQLLATFRVEAEEHMQAMSSGLLELEKTPHSVPEPALVESIFREAHSLKGAAGAVGLSEVETICQSLESILALWKSREMSPSPAQFDSLHHSLDAVGRLLAAGQSGASAMEAGMQSLAEDLASIKEVRPAPPPPGPRAEAPERQGQPFREEPPMETPVAPLIEPFTGRPPAVTREARGPMAETVRIATAKLDSLLLKAEETVAMKLTATQRCNELRELEELLEHGTKHWGRIQPEVRLMRQAGEARRAGDSIVAPRPAKIAEFFDWYQAHFKAIEMRVLALSRAVEHDRHSLGVMVDNLLDETKKLLMMPFGVLLGILPRLVRDIARDQGKEVQLVMHGGDVEIDKRILEEIKDPLVHLLRNCVDHGIEQPDAREHGGKPRQATITVTITQVSGSEVEVVVADDGAGIDMEKVKLGAIKQGLMSAEDAQRLDDLDVLPLIFQSGISTSPILTQISGRGLGLAIVREKVEKLSGHIFVHTHRCQGTTFRILLPLTLATFKGVLVQAAGQSFVLPTANLERVTRVKVADVKTVENRETIVLNDRAVSLVRLADVLEIPLPKDTTAVESFSALVLSAGDKRIAFRVEEVLNEQEVLVKPLGRPLVRVRNVAGATVLGSGKPVTILNAADLIKSAMKSGGIPQSGVRALRTGIGSGPAPGPASRGNSLLLAEDSITSRMLLKNILESAGYRVRTAVDGMDAWTALNTEMFDAVVTDVDMPRMSGFDLTQKIRGDKRLAGTPVVLVTGRETREDRERGIDAGADAYIIKSSFDQSNLLEVLQRLV